MSESEDYRDRLEIYRRERDGKWAWRLVVNHNVVATDHNQGYENREDAQDMAKRIVGGEFRDVTTWRIGE